MQFVNIAIVLAAIYIALALACSWLQEQFAAFTQLRAKTLQKGIVSLVSNETSVVKALIKHPLLTAGSSENHFHQFPSYLDKRNFSLAYWQTIASVASEGQPLVAEVTSGAAITNLITTVNGWQPTTPQLADVKRSAVALLTSAQGDYEKLLAATDDWFDSQMDRVTGWYKRNTQFVMLAIAFALAFGSGFDSIGIARQLFAQPEIANAMSESEAAVVRQQPSPAPTDAGAVQKNLQEVANVLLQSQQLQTLQLFWWSPVPNNPTLKSPIQSGNAGEKIAGLLLTAIAISLGAPFWFDILKGLVNVRMAGAKPADDASSTASASAVPAPAASAGSNGAQAPVTGRSGGG
jgi:hypothetical protein